VWGAPFGQWVAGQGVAPYGRGVGGAGPFWPCSGAVPKGVAVGGQSAKGRLPGGAVSGAPLLAREWLPAVCGQWAKFRLPSGAYRAVRWPVRGGAKGGQWGVAPLPV